MSASTRSKKTRENQPFSSKMAVFVYKFNVGSSAIARPDIVAGDPCAYAYMRDENIHDLYHGLASNAAVIATSPLFVSRH